MKAEIDAVDILSEQIALFEQASERTNNAVTHFSDRLKELLKNPQTSPQGTDACALSLKRSFKKAFCDARLGEQKNPSGADKSVTKIIDNLHKALSFSRKDRFLSAPPVGKKFSPKARDLFHAVSGRVSGFSQGGALSQNRAVPFANGGVVSRPSLFQMSGRMGVMGEAGPEAIMPLARGADGKLGVRGANTNATNITMNIQTRDAESFLRSKSQIAADINRALSRGKRNH